MNCQIISQYSASYQLLGVCLGDDTVRCYTP